MSTIVEMKCNKYAGNCKKFEYILEISKINLISGVKTCPYQTSAVHKTVSAKARCPLHSMTALDRFHCNYLLSANKAMIN